MKFILTCDPGLEDVVEREVEEKIKGAKFLGKLANFQGKVVIEAASSKSLLDLRSVHHVAKLVASFQIEHVDKRGLEEIGKRLEKLSLSPWMRGKKSFRISCQRIGSHHFTSIDVQRIAGKVVQEKYKLKVDLKRFQLNLKVDVFGKDVFVSIPITLKSLSKRFKLRFFHPAALKPTIAYGLIRIAEVKEGETVLDPMCGGGTILLELADIFKDKIKIFGGDINPKFVEGTILNARANLLSKFIKVMVLDATRLTSFFTPNSVDKIITDLPYGVRMKRWNLKELYMKFLESSSEILKPSGRIVALTLRANSFRSLALNAKKFKLVGERVIESGGLYPHVFVLEKFI